MKNKLKRFKHRLYNREKFAIALDMTNIITNYFGEPVEKKLSKHLLIFKWRKEEHGYGINMVYQLGQSNIHLITLSTRENKWWHDILLKGEICPIRLGDFKKVQEEVIALSLKEL